MKLLHGAMALEKRYIADRMKGVDMSLSERIAPYGYDNLADYAKDKKEYKFSKWIPEVRRTHITELATAMEESIRAKDYCVYIPTVTGVYAFYGSDALDLDLCESLGVLPVNVYHQGGTIIGSAEDLAIEIQMSSDIGMTGQEIINKFVEIIGKYIPNVTHDRNDILVDGKKVMGSMERRIGNVFVWAAQVSFADYSEYIEKLCNKQSLKVPGYIDSALLTRDVLEEEVLKWLQKR